MCVCVCVFANYNNNKKDTPSPRSPRYFAIKLTLIFVLFIVQLRYDYSYKENA